MVNSAKYISLTSDVWTASTNGTPFFSLTGHWLSETFEQQMAVLRVVPFQGSHTAQRISEELLKAIGTYDLAKSKIHTVLRDSGANMVAGVRESGLQSQSCFIHTLQLCINDSIFSQRAVKDIIAISRNIVTHFNHSPSAVNKLTIIQEQLGLKTHKLIQDVSTRWNSTFYMLQRILEQRKALVTYTVDHSIASLSEYQWSMADKLSHLLKPFEEITRGASKRESTTSIIIPTVLTLKLFLSKALKSRSFSGIVTTIEELETSVKRRFDAYLEEKSLCLSTFLDPRFKLKCQKNGLESSIKQWVTEELGKVRTGDIGEDSSSNPTEDPDKDMDTDAEEDRESRNSDSISLSACFDEIANVCPSPSLSTPDIVEVDHEQDQTSNQDLGQLPVVIQRQTSFKMKQNDPCNKEIHHYLNLPLLGREENPFQWWSNSRETLPLLSKLALKYLCAPSSSVESERLFSTGGNIYEPTRNRLCPENGEMLMFLHYNLRVFNLKY